MDDDRNVGLRLAHTQVAIVQVLSADFAACPCLERAFHASLRDKRKPRVWFVERGEPMVNKGVVLKLVLV